MLTSDLIRPRLRLHGDMLDIETISVKSKSWLQTAAELINLMQRQVGRTLADWDTVLEHYEGDRVDYVVVRGLAKVLTDAATFTPIQTPVVPTELRQRLFACGPAFSHSDLFHTAGRDEMVRSVAKEFGITVEQLEASLFADR